MQEDYLRKGNQLTEDQPVVNHLRIGGQGKFLHDADEDGRHHQHVGQVHRQGGFKEERLEEGGGKGDHQEEYRGQESAHHLAHHFPFQNKSHPNAFSRIDAVSVVEIPVSELKEGHVCFLFHKELLWN